MGCAQSTPTYYHADLLAVLRCDVTSWKGDRARQWFNSPLLTGDPEWNVHHGTTTAPARPRDSDWSKNSPLATEIVDILNGALKAMGGWPRLPICCGAGVEDVRWPPPQMVEAFNKVCKKLNEDKLFNVGLQCRVVSDRVDPLNPVCAFCVLVEKKSDTRDEFDTPKCTSDLNELTTHIAPGVRRHAKEALAWSPPADWMSSCYMRREALPTPYNE
jgi:hypothetical protein